MNPKATFSNVLQKLLEYDDEDEWDRQRRQEQREMEDLLRDIDGDKKRGGNSDEGPSPDADGEARSAGVPSVDAAGSDELAADAVAPPCPPPEEVAAAAAADDPANEADEELPEELDGDDADEEDTDADMDADMDKGGVEDDAEDADDEDGYMNDEAEEAQVEVVPEPEVANNGSAGGSSGFAIGDKVIISTHYDKKYAGASGVILEVFPGNDEIDETANVGDIWEAGQRVARNPIVTGILTELLQPQKNRSRTRSGAAES